MNKEKTEKLLTEETLQIDENELEEVEKLYFKTEELLYNFAFEYETNSQSLNEYLKSAKIIESYKQFFDQLEENKKIMRHSNF